MRRDWFAVLWLLGPLLWLFRRAMFLGELFAFRDAAHYYFPFYEYVQTRWQDGLPLWNPLDGIGQPMLGDPTAAVLYPGKLVFLLPVPYAQCFALYLVAHIWFAGFGAYKLSRSYRANWHGAIIAGLAYALSGQVLFQYCNPIYCVGAAWLPWAVLYLTRSMRQMRGWDVGLLCFTLSMMILGGDPQTAYHLLLLGLLYAILSCGIRGQRLVNLGRSVGLLCFVGAATVLLSAAQVFPTLEWAQRSDRALREGPRSVYEWAVDGAASVVEGSEFPSSRHLWYRNTGESHAEKVYQFSVGPWRWSELVWPNVTGRPFPVHRRWLSGFPGEGRMWTPSLYLGLLPLILSLHRFRLRKASMQTKWWSWTVVLSTAGAVGAYGFGWIIDEFRYSVDPTHFQNTGMLPGLGGVYWLMTVALPGYVGFRYPAKLWTIATLGLAMLAARGWPAVVIRQRRLAKQNIWLILISLGLAALALTSIASSRLSQVPANRLFGPLDVDASRIDLAVSFLHAVAVASGILLLLKWGRNKKLDWAFVCLVAVELSIAQASLVQTVPSAQWKGMPSSAIGATLYRCETVRAYPERWEHTSSASRFQELRQNDLTTLMPKHHLTAGIRSVRSAVPMTSADYFVLAELARMIGQKHASGHQIPDHEWINLLGASYVIAPRDDFAFADRVAGEQAGSSIAHSINTDALPRTWLVHHWQSLNELEQFDHEALLRRTKRVILDGTAFRDFQETAMVESSAPLAKPAPSDSAFADVCKLLEEDDERILLHVKTDAPAIVVLADQYYPGWKASVSSKTAGSTPTGILRVNRVMRGVYVEAGDYEIEFLYRPFSVFLGIGTSVLAWIVLVLAMTSSGRRRISNLKVERLAQL